MNKMYNGLMALIGGVCLGFGIIALIVAGIPHSAPNVEEMKVAALFLIAAVICFK